MFRRLLLLILVLLIAAVAYVFINKSNQDDSNTSTSNKNSQLILEPETEAKEKPKAKISSIKPTTPDTPSVVDFSQVSTPEIEAKSWMLFDMNSGQIVAQENPDIKVEPASLTKLMTAALIFDALEKGSLSLDQEVTVSPEARAAEGSRTFIEVNTRVSIEDLIKGMVVQSGNDATIQLAQAVSGSVNVFVNEMNKRAKEYGMENSHFAGPAGMPSPDTYVTARDVSVLAQHIIKDYPKYYHYFSIEDFTYNNIKQANRNGLLKKDIGVDGLKTGHTDSAGYSLVASAQRDNRRLISIVIGADSVRQRERANESLLDWGYQNFINKVVAEADEPIIQSRVWEGEKKEAKLGSQNQVAVTVPRGEEKNIQAMTVLNQKLVAPLKKNQVVGSVQFILNGQVVKQDPLVVIEEVKQGTFFKRLIDKAFALFD